MREKKKRKDKEKEEEGEEKEKEKEEEEEEEVTENFFFSQLWPSAESRKEGRVERKAE